MQFVNNKEFLPDSYTAFKNKIGLSDDGGETYLSRRRDVALVWPFGVEQMDYLETTAL